MRLRDAEAVLALNPDPTAPPGVKIGVIGAWPEHRECQEEIRAFDGSGAEPVVWVGGQTRTLFRGIASC